MITLAGGTPAGGSSRLLADWCMYAVAGRLRRWRLRLPAGPVGRRRAGVTALALLAVTAAAVRLLAVVFRLGVPAAAAGIAGILATVPGAYLAWAMLPVRRPPVHGRPAGRWDPVELGVHQVIGGGPMPTYVRRPHDDLLRAVLDPAVSASRLVVVRGVSSTGKTRAAYEGIWSLLKRAIANFAAADLAGLVRIIKRKLKKIQYRPHLIDGCLAKTGLTIEPW